MHGGSAGGRRLVQIFHRSTNTISKVSIFGALFGVAALLGLFDKVNRSSWMTQARGRT